VGGGSDGTLVELVGSFLWRQSPAISVLPPLGVHIYSYASLHLDSTTYIVAGVMQHFRFGLSTQGVLFEPPLRTVIR
ncbi:unnamed protein product, partial [Ixodes persulcatus]